MGSTTESGKVTLKIAIDTTTPGAVLLTGFAPALLGVLLAVEELGRVPPLLSAILLLIPALMNAAVASLNDYFDYVSGNDTPENVVSEIDGPLAYHRIKNPKPVLYFALGLSALAAIFGGVVIYLRGVIPAVVGGVGAVIGLTYSGMKPGSSYLPIGEPLAGFTLGGLVPLGVCSTLTGRIDALVLFKAIPMMLIVSEFMLANNTCDIERDREVGRKTLPILIGRAAAEKMANVMTVFWLCQLALVIAVWYRFGLPLLAAALFLCRKGAADTFRLERTHENKTPVTAALTQVTIAVALGDLTAVGLHLLIENIM